MSDLNRLPERWDHKYVGTLLGAEVTIVMEDSPKHPDEMPATMTHDGLDVTHINSWPTDTSLKVSE